MSIHLLVLNYNGRDLLAECLPSVVQAAEASRHACRVSVIDNSSTDDSLAFLSREFPQVRAWRRPNEGLCSFNAVLANLDEPVVVLLNNDIKLACDAVDPLVEPLLPSANDSSSASPPRCFMTAPLCWRFDGATYEGLKTSIRWRWGLVQATSLFPGNETTRLIPGLTASAGAALAVDRQVFLELGGFDPLYLPGRLEDLDFAFRGYQAGYEARFVPDSVMYHRGQTTFEAVFGAAGCDQLALRNTLLFQWKNLRDPLHLLRQIGALPIRVLRDVARAAWTPREERFVFCRALAAAWRRRRAVPRSHSSGEVAADHRKNEREFFRRFHPRVMRVAA